MYKAILVDDEPLILDTLKDFVDWDKYGITVCSTFQSGQEALDYLRDNQCDIIITDVRMPVIDGITMTRKARDAGCDAKIVFLSGYDDFEYIKSALKVNACDYLLKPVDFEEIDATLTRIESLLRKSESTVSVDFFYEGFQHEKPDLDADSSVYESKDFSKLFYQAITENNHSLLETQCQIYFKYHAYNKTSRDMLNADINKVFLELVSDYIPYSGHLIPVISKLYSIKTAKEMEAYVYRCLTAISEYYNKPVTDPKIIHVNKIIRTIQENYKSINSIEDISTKLYLSPSYIRDLFKKYTGKTVNDYLKEVRLNNAIELLKDGNLKIKCIAEMVGYKTESYFCSLFKEFKGLTPYEYRKKYFNI